MQYRVIVTPATVTNASSATILIQMDNSYMCTCCVCTCVCMYVCMYDVRYVCMYDVRMYVCMMYVCMYVCMMYVCMYDVRCMYV